MATINDVREFITERMNRSPMSVSNDTLAKEANTLRKMALDVMSDYNNWLDPANPFLDTIGGPNVPSADKTKPFGYSKLNPIPCCDVPGEIEYLSRLYVNDEDDRVMFHRLGSVTGCGDEMVDHFECLSFSGHYFTLYLNMYHKIQCQEVPEGLKIMPKMENVSGMTEGLTDSKSFFIAPEFLHGTFMGAISCFGVPLLWERLNNPNYFTVEKIDELSTAFERGRQNNGTV